MGSYVFGGDSSNVLETSYLVVAGFGDGISRTARDTLPADPIREKKTVGMMIFIGSGRGGDPDTNNNRTCAHGLS